MSAYDTSPTDPRHGGKISVIADREVIEIVASAVADGCCEIRDDNGACCMMSRATQIVADIEAADYRLETVERINAILSSRDHWRGLATQRRILEAELAVALGVSHLSGDAQLAAAVAEVKRLKGEAA